MKLINGCWLNFACQNLSGGCSEFYSSFFTQWYPTLRVNFSYLLKQNHCTKVYVPKKTWQLKTKLLWHDITEHDLNISLENTNWAWNICQNGTLHESEIKVFFGAVHCQNCIVTYIVYSTQAWRQTKYQNRKDRKLRCVKWYEVHISLIFNLVL